MILYAFLLSVAAVAVASATAPVLPETLTWKSDAHGVSIVYPADWQVFHHPQALLLLAAPTTPSEKFVDSFSVVMEDLTGRPMSLDDYMNAALEHLRVVPDLKVRDLTTTSLDGQPARRLVCAGYGARKEPYVFEQVVTLRASTAYVFTFTCETERKYAVYGATVATMLNSVRFTAIPTTAPALR